MVPELLFAVAGSGSLRRLFLALAFWNFVVFGVAG